MGARLDDGPGVEDHHAVRAGGRGEAVGHHDGGAPPGEGLDGRGDPPFGGEVE